MVLTLPQSLEARQILTARPEWIVQHGRNPEFRLYLSRVKRRGPVSARAGCSTRALTRDDKQHRWMMFAAVHFSGVLRYRPRRILLCAAGRICSRLHGPANAAATNPINMGYSHQGESDSMCHANIALMQY
jgi:hypothetical protein